MRRWSKEKPLQSSITFDTPLQTALLSYIALPHCRFDVRRLVVKQHFSFESARFAMTLNPNW